VFYSIDDEVAEMQRAGWKLPEQAEYFTVEETLKILNSKFLDESTPRGLILRIFFNLGVMIGVRPKTHHDLQRGWFDDNKLQRESSSGRAYFRMPFMLDKNYQGGLKFLGREKELSYIVWENPDDPANNVYRLLKKYFKVIPKDCKHNNFP